MTGDKFIFCNEQITPDLHLRNLVKQVIMVRKEFDAHLLIEYRQILVNLALMLIILIQRNIQGTQFLRDLFVLDHVNNSHCKRHCCVCQTS